MEDGDIQSIRTGLSPIPLPVARMGLDSMPGAEESGISTQDVIILEPGQEQAQKFIKAISNQTAGEALQLLKEAGPLRLSDIAEKLGLSLNATKYHIENLMEAGLLEISNTRYSVKGRKIKMYRMKNQIFIVAPALTEKKQIISAVLKYGSFLGVYIVVAVAFLAFIPLTAITGSIPLAGSLQPGVPVSSAAVMPEFIASTIAGLIMAAFVTILALIAYQVLARRKQDNLSSLL
jgi:DNA-binding transcriptional ArsR family regulator